MIKIDLLFSVLLILATIGCYLASYLSKPTDEETLLSFYKKVRPWGFWKPIYDKVEAQDPGFERNKNFKRDMVNVLVGIVWQTALVALPVYIVLMKWTPSLLCAVITVATSWFLKKNWLDKLED